MTVQQPSSVDGNSTTASPVPAAASDAAMKAATKTEDREKKPEERQGWVSKGWLGMVPRLFHRYRKYFVVLGGILVYIPIGVPWYFGNLAAYLASYFRQKDVLDMQATYIADPQWIFSAFFVAFSLAIVVSGYMAHTLGTILTVFIAIVIHSGATFLSYFAIQHSMVALILTFGAMGGLGAGLAYGPPMSTVSKWLPRNVGVASGVLLTGFGGGSIIYNEMITFYINPNNIQPDVTTERTSYFSQPEVLDQIPKVFLILGSITVSLQLLGLTLIRNPQEGDEIDEPDNMELKPIVDKSKGSKESAGELTEVDLQSDSASQPLAEAEHKELSPLEVLKQKDFYLLWLALGLNHYGYVIKNNYYKEFGAAKVDNDHLLTTIGTVSTVAVAVCRLTWGIVSDLFGVKMTVILLLGGTSFLASFWYFTLEVSPALYFVWTVAMTFFLAGAFIVFPLAALAAFGQRHYTTNYGLISTVQIVVNLLSPLVIRSLLDNYGWYSIFISISASNCAGTIAVLFLSVK